MIGQILEEIVSHIPSRREAVADDAHQFPLAADILIKHDHLQAKEDFGVYARTTRGGVETLHHLPYEREIEPLLKAAVEVLLRNELFEGDILGQWVKLALLDPHHGDASC